MATYQYTRFKTAPVGPCERTHVSCGLLNRPLQRGKRDAPISLLDVAGNVEAWRRGVVELVIDDR